MERYYKIVLLLLRVLLICDHSVTGRLTGSSMLNGRTFEWTHTAKLPSGIVLNWIDSDPEIVTFEMSGPTKGYLSIGFSPGGGMTGADIFVGWVDSLTGEAHILDMHGTHNGQPVLDKVQDLELIGGKQDEDGTRIIFRRKWDTCDEKEDFPIGTDTMRLIWAIHPDDPKWKESNEEFLPAYHGHDVTTRGVRSIYMKVLPNPRKFPDEEDVYPEDVQQLDLTVDRISVPKTETMYHCRIVKFPKLTSKHHIIAFRPIIAPKSIPHVHHIAVFKCHIPESLGIRPESVFEKYLNHPGGDCYTKEAPREWTEYCFEFRVAIGAGSEGDMMPDHLGDVIGDTDAPTYYRLEVHYENPQGKELIDSSGVRIFYTSKLRQYETAVLFAGHRRTPFVTIPPHQKEYRIYGFCGSECTSKGFPSDGIKIVSVLLHAHLTARKLILRHIRNGKELEPIAQDNHYDFNYQHFRVLKEERAILPGDELITECTYDTEKNDTFVYGGLSTRREMCESFIIYYPKSPLIDCRSQVEFYSYMEAIGVQNATGSLLKTLTLPFSSKMLPPKMQNSAWPDDSLILENGRTNTIQHDLFRNVTITMPEHLQGQNVHDYMTELNWENGAFVKSVEQKRKLGKHYMHCSAAGGIKIHTSRDVYRFPRYEPYKVENEKTCLPALQQVGTSSGSVVKTWSVLLQAIYLPVAVLLRVFYCF